MAPQSQLFHTIPEDWPDKMAAALSGWKDHLQTFCISEQDLKFVSARAVFRLVRELPEHPLIVSSAEIATGSDIENCLKFAAFNRAKRIQRDILEKERCRRG